MPLSYRHVPVLQKELIDLLQPLSNENFIDGTVGGAGHALAILERTGPEGILLGLDLDPRAITVASDRLARFGTRARVVKGDYARIAELCRSHLSGKLISGIILDLGLSSDQLDASERGFSFKDLGVADMRFDPETGKSASDLLMSLTEDELYALLREYGEVRGARRVARALINMRERAGKANRHITVPMLLETLEPFGSLSRKGIHPATTVFQALRIATNAELERIHQFLPQALKILRPGGKLGIISYHSLEDRIVKDFFKREARECVCPPETPVCRCGHVRTVKILTPKPGRPTEREQRENPRSRSARLRIAQKII